MAGKAAPIPGATASPKENKRLAQKKLPTVLLRAGEDRRVRAGSPWAFSNEILMDAETKALPPGSLATLRAPGGEALGLVPFNPHSLIAGRVLSSNPEATVDALFLGRRLAQAAALRDRLIGVPFYRLIHAEADGLPGVIVDRFGDALVVQVNTAGMELLTPGLLEALEAELSPKTIVLKNDSPVRELEGLKREVTVAKGDASGTVELIENGARFVADPCGGQKTRLVLRPARQPPLHGGSGEGCARPRCLQLQRRLRRAGRHARRQVGDLHRPLPACAQRGQGGG